MAPKVDPWVRVFDVSEPTKHFKGYTVYKVTSKVYPRNSPEAVTEVVVWKRYSDFKKLHKVLQTLHSKLYLKGVFPSFAKSRLFGRFDDEVIEERRISALNLLEFAAQHPPLFTSQIFVKFFEEGQKITSSTDIVQLPDKILQPFKIEKPLVDTSSVSLADTILPEVELDRNNSSDVGPALGGVWQYRQNQDSISFTSTSSDDEKTIQSDSDSAVSTPLPVEDMTLFDPLANKKLDIDKEKAVRHCSNSWLLTAMFDCSQLEKQSTNGSETSLTSLSLAYPKPFADYEELPTPPKPGCNSRKPSQSLIAHDIVDTVCQASESEISIPSSSTVKLDEPRNSVITVSSQKNKDIVPNVTERKNSSETKSKNSPNLSLNQIPSEKVSVSTLSPLSPLNVTGADVVTNYLFEAANHISLAQQNEANGNFENAFSYYKSGVGILLEGVQGDANGDRREAVRRKTEQYLMRAEELYNKYLISRVQDDNRWAVNSRLSPTIDRNITVGLLKVPVSELQNYRVLGMIDKVLLVLDKKTEKTCVIKVLYKSPNSTRSGKPSIAPSQIPFMVQLYKIIETDYAVFLILQHAGGGKLWHYISTYLQNSPLSPRKNYGDNLHYHYIEHESPASENVYSGKKLLTEDESGLGSEILNESKDRETNLADSLSFDLQTALENSVSCVELLTNYGKAQNSAKYNAKTFQLSDKTEMLHMSNNVSGLSERLSHEEFCNSENHSSKALLQESSSKLQHFSIVSSDGESEVQDTDKYVVYWNGIYEESLSPILPSKEEETNTIPCDIGKIKTLEDLEKLDAQELISSAQRLLKNVDKTLQESNNRICKDNDISNENLCSSSKDIEVNAEDKERIQNSHRKASHKDTWSNRNLNKFSQDINACQSNKEDLVKGIKNRNSSVSSANERRRSVHRSIQRQVSEDSAFASPVHERHLSSSAGSLGITRPRLRHLSQVFQQLDNMASESKAYVCLPEDCVRIWAAEMIIAISRLHTLGIICRDLQPHNILLGDRGHILLTYFSQWSSVDTTISLSAVDNMYAAPEVSSIFDVTPACDWWSLGALLFELLTSKTLASCHPGGINSHTQLYIPSHVSPEAQSLLKELLRYNVNERLGAEPDSFEAIKAHPFFKSIDWNRIQNSC